MLIRENEAGYNDKNEKGQKAYEKIAFLYRAAPTSPSYWAAQRTGFASTVCPDSFPILVHVASTPLCCICMHSPHRMTFLVAGVTLPNRLVGVFGLTESVG